MAFNNHLTSESDVLDNQTSFEVKLCGNNATVEFFSEAKMILENLFAKKKFVFFLLTRINCHYCLMVFS